MSDGPELTASRRQFLLGSSAAAATLGTTAVRASAETADLAASATVVLHDPRIAMDPAVAQRLVAGGARIIALDDDPVRMWRSQIGAVLGDPATRLFGVTRWADLLIVRGLAAESRRHVLFERLDAGSGTLTWLIA